MDTISINEAIRQKSCGDRKEAEKMFWLLTDSQQETDRAWYYLGLMATEEGDVEKAIGYYEAAIKSNPDNFRAHNNQGALYLQNEQYREAYTCFENAHQLMPNDVFPVYNMGIASWGFGEINLALKHYSHAGKMDGIASLPLDAQQDLLLKTGDCYLQLGQLDDAYEQYENACRQPSFIQFKAFNQLGLISLEYRKNFEIANDWIDKALALNPDFQPSIQNKGLVLMAMGRSEEAVPYMKQVIELDPSNFEGYYNIACVYCALRQEEAAQKAVTTALELFPAIKDHLKQDQDFAIYAQTKWFRNLTK